MSIGATAAEPVVAEATTLPWFANGGYDVQAPTQPGGLPRIVAYVLPCRSDSVEERRANLDLLVRGANHHTELVRALEFYLAAVKDFAKTKGISLQFGPLCEAEERARALLRKIKTEPGAGR